MNKKADLRYFHAFDRVLSVERTARGVEMEVDSELRERLRVDVIRPDILRLKISQAGRFDEAPTFAVCAALDKEESFSVEETPEAVKLTTSRLVLSIFKNPFRMAAHRNDGAVIFETSVDEEGRSWAYATLNDEFIVSRKCRREDAFYGLGEKTGRFNRRGRDFTLWNTDVLDTTMTGYTPNPPPGTPPRQDAGSTEFDPYYISIPFFYHQGHESSGMAGFFIDNGYRGHFDFSDATEYRFHFSGGQYTEYLFAGPAMRDILSGYTWLTGRMQPPPLWALGYHQCRWFAYTQETVWQLAQRYRDKHFPCDAVWLDIDYMDGYRVFTWDRNAFPDPATMLGKLRADGFRVVTIIDPGVKYERGNEVFEEGLARDVFCKTANGNIYLGQVWPGRTAFPDFSTPEARRWWGERNAAHVQSGLSGIWNDMNEPATGAIPADSMRFGDGQYPHERYHNQYGLLMAMGTTAGLLEAMPDARPFVLSRAGFSGIQRYAANWMGDNTSRWEHLWMSLPMALGLGISGQPFVGADIGGFIGESNAELVTRWYQCGALTPFCRNHNCRNQSDQYPWVFGDFVEESCRAAIEMRYRLMPYIYSTFMRSAETGMPVQRPLLLEFQDDRTTRDLDDQFLLGDHLLVAPIYKAGETARHVYLPAGTWHQWHTGEKLSGRNWVVAQAPMRHIPVYARGGAVIPMWPEAPASTMGYSPETVELHIFMPEEDGDWRSILHEDDGHTFAYREGAYWRTEFVLSRRGLELTIRAEVSGSGYSSFSRKQFRLIFKGAILEKVSLDGGVLMLEGNAGLIANAGRGFLLSGSLVSSAPA